jgi:hypothetical protein
MATHEVLRDADPRWMYLGCVIPDLPWILQRILLVAVPGIDPYALWAYLVVQASLFGGLLVCTAAALLTDRFWRTCAILEGNAALHLVLDALQTKWGSGVHFFAPVSWTSTNWGLFWPESIVTYGLTTLGVLYIVWHGRASIRQRLNLIRPGGVRLAGIVVLLAVYFTIPLFLLHGPVEADAHSLKALHVSAERVGHRVALDQARYVNTPDGPRLELYKGRVQLRVEKLDVQPPATVSVRGVLTGADTIRVTDHYVHAGRMRDYPSYLGLAFIAFVWTIAGWRAYRT